MDGHIASDGEGNAVLFDPAVYYGDAETDIAMTHLFGRLPGRFYDACMTVLPSGSDAGMRRVLYNLHYVLNHVNLFGGGCSAQASVMLTQLNAMVKD